MQGQKEVSAHVSSEQMLPFNFAGHSIHRISQTQYVYTQTICITFAQRRHNIIDVTGHIVAVLAKC